MKNAMDVSHRQEEAQRQGSLNAQRNFETQLKPDTEPTRDFQ